MSGKRECRVLLLGSALMVGGAMGGCSLASREEPVGYYQQQPTYQQSAYQQPVYEQGRPTVVYGGQEQRSPAHFAMERLRQADASVQAGDLNGAKDNLRSARDALRSVARDERTDAALARIADALDAANHTRPRITQDRIQDAESVLRQSARYEASDR